MTALTEDFPTGTPPPQYPAPRHHNHRLQRFDPHQYYSDNNKHPHAVIDKLLIDIKNVYLQFDLNVAVHTYIVDYV
jgi:hypothetical protein